MFGQSVAVAVALSTASFLLFFAWLEDDLWRNPLRFFPSNMYWLNSAAGSAGGGHRPGPVHVSLYVFRHRETALHGAVSPPALV